MPFQSSSQTDLSTNESTTCKQLLFCLRRPFHFSTLLYRISENGYSKQVYSWNTCLAFHQATQLHYVHQYHSCCLSEKGPYDRSKVLFTVEYVSSSPSSCNFNSLPDIFFPLYKVNGVKWEDQPEARKIRPFEIHYFMTSNFQFEWGSLLKQPCWLFFIVYKNGTS